MVFAFTWFGAPSSTGGRHVGRRCGAALARPKMSTTPRRARLGQPRHRRRRTPRLWFRMPGAQRGTQAGLRPECDLARSWRQVVRSCESQLRENERGVAGGERGRASGEEGARHRIRLQRARLRRGCRNSHAAHPMQLIHSNPRTSKAPAPAPQGCAFYTVVAAAYILGHAHPHADSAAGNRGSLMPMTPGTAMPLTPLNQWQQRQPEM